MNYPTVVSLQEVQDNNGPTNDNGKLQQLSGYTIQLKHKSLTTRSRVV